MPEAIKQSVMISGKVCGYLTEHHVGLLSLACSCKGYGQEKERLDCIDGRIIDVQCSSCSHGIVLAQSDRGMVAVWMRRISRLIIRLYSLLNLQSTYLALTAYMEYSRKFGTWFS